MSRSVGGALGILMTAALASAQEGGPPLSPPELAPPAEASSPPPAPATAKPAARHPFLVITGVNTPAPAATRSPQARAVEPKPAAPPPLAGPASAAVPEPVAPTVTMPLTLEAIPEDEKSDDAVGSKARVEAPAAPRRRATTPAPPEEGESPRYVPGTMLGRLLGIGDGRDDVKGAISVESKADPAVDAAVKRRIEKAVKESLGDRASEVDVRVKGRSVLIRARASRFWHRRGVRRALESFPLPSGYHGRAELMD
jgi:hypothetical protein